MDQVLVTVHKCKYKGFTFIPWFHKYGDIEKFSHYAISFSSETKNRLFLDSTEKNVSLYSSDIFLKDYEPVGQSHHFVFDKIEFMSWYESLPGRKYGYIELIGLGLKKLGLFRSNPFGRGSKIIICNELILLMLEHFFKIDLDTDNMDLVETERLLLKYRRA